MAQGDDAPNASSALEAVDLVMFVEDAQGSDTLGSRAAGFDSASPAVWAEACCARPAHGTTLEITNITGQLSLC